MLIFYFLSAIFLFVSYIRGKKNLVSYSNLALNGPARE